MKEKGNRHIVHKIRSHMYLFMFVFSFLLLWICRDNYHNTGCLNCWRFSDLLGNWRPAPLYVTMGVALMLYPHNLWLSYVAGMLLLLLALLRLGTLLPLGGHTTSPHKEEGLLPQCDFEKWHIPRAVNLRTAHTYQHSNTFLIACRVSSFVDSVEDDFAEVSVSQPDDDEAPIDDDVC